MPTIVGVYSCLGSFAKGLRAFENIFFFYLFFPEIFFKLLFGEKKEKGEVGWSIESKKTPNPRNSKTWPWAFLLRRRAG